MDRLSSVTVDSAFRRLRNLHLEVIGILILASLLYLFRLDFSPIWRDETFHIFFARLPPADAARYVLKFQPYQALHCLMLYPWITAFGNSAFVVRLPSVVFAVLAVAALYWLGRILFDRPIALTAAAMLSVNAFFLRYAQEARAYSLITFLIICSWLFLIECARRPSVVKATAYAFISAAAPWGHFLVTAMYPAQLAALVIFIRPRGKTWRYLIPAGLTIGISSAIIAWLIIHDDTGQSSWLRRWHSDLGYMALRFAGATFGHKPFMWAVRIIYAAGALAGILQLIRPSSVSPKAQFAGLGCAFLAGAVPPILVFCVSLIKPMFIDRYLLTSLPFAVLFVAAGLWAIRPPIVSVTLSVVVVMSAFAVDHAYYVEQPRDWAAWPDGIEYIQRYAQPADKVVLVPGYCRLEFDYNLEKSAHPADFPEIEYPRWDGFMQYGGKFVADRAVAEFNPMLAAALNRTYSRLWVVSCVDRSFLDQGTADLLTAVRLRYGECKMKTFHALTIQQCISDKSAASTER
jgi:mannosyltransferase